MTKSLFFIISSRDGSSLREGEILGLNMKILNSSSAASAALVLGSVVASSQASAIVALDVPLYFGGQADGYAARCITAGCPGGGVAGGGIVSYFDDDSNVGGGASSSISGVQGSGSANATFVSLGAGLSTFKLTGTATGSVTGDNGNGGFANVAARAVDGYTYNGAGPLALTLTLDLTGSLSWPTSGADSNLDGIFAEMHVFTNPFDISFINDSLSFGEVDLSGCFGECFTPEDSAYASIINPTANGSASDTIDLLLNPGDSFYLYGSLGMGGAGGGTASSLNSFDVVFSSTQGLTSTSAIPVPAAAWLFGSALLGMFAAIRNR